MKYILAVFLLALAIVACNNQASEEHAHAPDGSHPGEEALQSISHTVYSDKSELFVEYKPLIVGRTSKFAVHLTRLGEKFVPYSEGIVTVNLVQGDKGLKNTITAPGSPGIFRLALQ